MEQLRLCIVNPFQHGGGAEFQIDCLINKLAESPRYKIYYLAHYIEPGLEAGRYTVEKIGRDNVWQRLFGYSADVLSLYRALRRIQPHVIYQRVAGPYTGVCGLYARRHRVRFVWHVAHDTDVTPGGMPSGRNFMRNTLDKCWVEFGLRHADRIVVQKQDQAVLLDKYYGRKATAIIPNFHPDPQETIDKSDPFTVIWVANLKPWKRPEVFVRLATQMRDLKEVRFVMVGRNDAANSHWGDELLRLIEATPNLSYVGEKSQREVNELLARAHVFVNTSEHEGFPNTFIQAWMREVPVVSLDVNPDGIFDRQPIGIHAGSEAQLAAVVRRFVEEPAMRTTYASRASEYACEQHSIRNVERLRDVIETDA